MSECANRSKQEIDAQIGRLNAELAQNGNDVFNFDRIVRAISALKDEKKRLDEPATLPSSTKPPQRKARRAPTPPAPDTIPARWGDAVRGIPNDLIRSGLFNIRRGEDREQLTNNLIATFGNARMFYTGEELRIKDEDVLMQIYHFQQQFRLGEAWQVNGQDFLTQMHWTDGARGYAELYASLLRISKGHLTLTRPGAAEDAIVIEAGAMLSHLKIDHGGRSGPTSITIAVNPETKKLWETLGYTLVDWKQRLSLGGSLARYLHRFYSSFDEPYDLKVSTLHRLTGSATSTLAKFTQQLKDALDDLVEIGFLTAYWIQKDLVHVVRTGAAIEHEKP